MPGEEGKGHPDLKIGWQRCNWRRPQPTSGPRRRERCAVRHWKPVVGSLRRCRPAGKGDQPVLPVPQRPHGPWPRPGQLLVPHRQRCGCLPAHCCVQGQELSPLCPVRLWARRLEEGSQQATPDVCAAGVVSAAAAAAAAAGSAHDVNLDAEWSFHLAALRGPAKAHRGQEYPPPAWAALGAEAWRPAALFQATEAAP